LIAGGVTGGVAPAVASAWYVDGVAGSPTWPPVTCSSGATAGTTATCAFQQLWQALKEVQPGDTIYVVGSMVYPNLGLTASGTAAAPITLAGANAQAPTQVSGGGVNTGIWINADHVVVRGFDVTAPGVYPAISVASNHHSVVITSNVVHDAGGNGVNVVGDDYVTISNNVVYGNAGNTTQAYNSGISIKGSIDVDTNTGIKMQVIGNTVFNNTNIPNCSTAQCLATAADTDGNGIILDRNESPGTPYGGAFRVANNVVYQNGGRGIYVYRTANATVTDNSLYENNQDPYESYYHPGEVSVNAGGNVGIYNNILYSDGGVGPGGSASYPNTHVAVSVEYCTDGTGPMTVQTNLAYNPQGDQTLLYYGKGNTDAVTVSGNPWTGPKFEGPSAGDFRFQPASPAYQSGAPATSISHDILGASRFPSPSIGAYQNPGP
jgi:serralysin